MSFKRGLANILEKKPTDIVIISALRTPITKSLKGGLAHTHPEELLATVLSATLTRTSLDPKHVRDVLVGAVLQTLGGQKASAAAVKHVGFPATTTVNTINRQCASSAQAMAVMANTIRSGSIECGIAAGTESMSLDYFPHRGIPWRVADRIGKGSDKQEARDVLMPMGVTSENVAREYGITRDQQDVFAEGSHRKATEAWEKGWFDPEVVPVDARKLTPKEGNAVASPGEVQEEEMEESFVTVARDDGFRPGLSVEKLGKLKPVFAADGTTTAGNSSQISDGASATLLMTRSLADSLHLKPIGKYVHSAIMGVPSRIMGTSPVIAIPELLRLTGVEKNEVDVWELNEAFASQSVYCIRELGLDPEKVNPMGGAIALGHPLGATGGRLVATLLNGLKLRGGKVGVLSMCASTGQGYAGMVVRED